MSGGRKRVLAVSSGGGHWQQLMQLRPAFAHHDCHFATTVAGLAEQYAATPAHLIPDCNRNAPLAALRALSATRTLVRQVRPDVVISTGAMPGVLTLWWGRRHGARTIWVDSVANAERLSMSGALALRFADLCLAQWETVARETGARHAGALL